MEQARSVTGLDNPNSPVQLKAWLAEKGVEADSLSKAAVADMLEKADGEVELALSLRQELAKSSVKKYTAMQTVVGSDDRARGLIQFYGANRTGRYAGRLIQVQNLPQNHLPDLDTARALVRSGNTDAVEMLYDSVPLVLSELIRTAFVPKPGCRFYVADFSAIEARVIAWIAGEHWRQEVFAKGGDIYCASASQMFHVPVEKHGVNGHLRQKGKIAELALGYGGSVGALKAMGALNYGLQEEELKPLVDAWRLSNPHITKFWWDVDKAASTCVRERTATETHGIRFYYQSGMMFVVLPSGRRLVYVKPKMGMNRFGNESVTYEGVGEQKKWLCLESYGPKFVENIVQATARDILAEAMLRLNAAGYRIVMHVHDEAVIEAPLDTSLENICSVMRQTPTWASGLLLRADGYGTIYADFGDSSYTNPDIYGDGSNVWNCTCMLGEGLSLVFDFASDYEDPAAMPIYARIDDFMYWSGSTTGAALCPGLSMGMTYAEAAATIGLTPLEWAPEQTWSEPVYLSYGGDAGCALELYFIGSSEETAVLVSVNAIPIG